ncbi:hypothetical protein OsJ_22436 [Oryza sativa Japonica Group]|uniref:Uncharacterized protein n=1 Tax=Oryza sativa subsp. japonica TaxID=39947 RepID=B9FQL0_ORYSJ|nr:hypothetical protein OsJ_22436 [Oryza sativa Japonica Group]
MAALRGYFQSAKVAEEQAVEIAAVLAPGGLPRSRRAHQLGAELKLPRAAGRASEVQLLCKLHEQRVPGIGAPPAPPTSWPTAWNGPCIIVDFPGAGMYGAAGVVTNPRARKPARARPRQPAACHACPIHSLLDCHSRSTIVVSRQACSRAKWPLTRVERAATTTTRSGVSRQGAGERNRPPIDEFPRSTPAAGGKRPVVAESTSSAFSFTTMETVECLELARARTLVLRLFVEQAWALICENHDSNSWTKLQNFEVSLLARGAPSARLRQKIKSRARGAD